VVLDLDGDGVELVSFRESTVAFSANEDAPPSITGWVAADDAILVLDRNGDGKINNGTEVSFIGDSAGATSDLEGLAGFDTNGDGVFGIDDRRYDEFQLWQDANQDGISQSNELRSMRDAGIVGIDLNRQLTGEATSGAPDNVVTATSYFVRDDGTTGTVGDVSLRYLGLGDANEIETAASPGPIADDHHVEDASQVEEASGIVIADEMQTPQSQEDGISDVDRSADAEAATLMSLQDARRSQLPAEEIEPADIPSIERDQETTALNPAATDVDERKDRRPRDQEPLAKPDQQEPADEPEFFTSWRRGALHADLGLVGKRRLQMIEAMASFNAEETAGLALQPQRRVDAKTLELLTAVDSSRYVA
jgi:hypothetical protein